MDIIELFKIFVLLVLTSLLIDKVTNDKFSWLESIMLALMVLVFHAICVVFKYDYNVITMIIVATLSRLFIKKLGVK